VIRRALLVAGAAAAVYAGWIEPRRLVIVHARLELPRWPARLDGLRVGLLTDIHAGAPHVTPAAIARAVERLNDAAPDVILLGGDYIDAHPLWGGRVDPDTIAGELRNLTAPLGVFGVLGNHDWKQTGDRMWAALERAGIPVLENRALPAGEVYVAGIADLRQRRPDVPATLAQIPPEAPVIVLAHDPDVFPLVPARVALAVSGHTHGGQVAIPRLRRPVIPSYYGERYARGHVEEDGRHLYVSSGLGTSGLPIRVLAPPEVVILELAAA
jgi:predicted MPP superfamily phosphohydrolase